MLLPNASYKKQSSKYLSLMIEFRSVKCHTILRLSIARKPISRSLTFSSIVSGTFSAIRGSNLAYIGTTWRTR